MGLISIPTISDGTVIDANDVNNPLNTIVNEINGNISYDNLANDAITTDKIATGAVTTSKIADDAVTSAKIPDNSVTSEKLNSTVAFSAYKTANLNIAHNTVTTVTGFTENFDFGSNFNDSTGIFTAPYDGVYHFDCGGMIDNLTTGKTQYIYLMHNGSIHRRDKSVIGDVNWEGTGTVSTPINCSAGDTVYMACYHDFGSIRDIVAGSFTWFSGFLVGRT